MWSFSRSIQPVLHNLDHGPNLTYRLQKDEPLAIPHDVIGGDFASRPEPALRKKRQALPSEKYGLVRTGTEYNVLGAT